MPKIEVHHDVAIRRSFRVEQICGVFDVSLADRSRVDLSVHVPPESGGGSDWKIGAIIGPSGSGKSSVARQAWGDRFIEGFDWPTDASILDGFPAELPNKQITGTLTSVGFSSPPDWVRPYRCLSTGQRFRANLARALLMPGLVAVDEFGGTVTQQVAEYCAASVAKAIRAGRVDCERFVAVGARDEFVRWLEPDWVVDMGERRLARGWVQRERAQPWSRAFFAGRPRIEIDIHRVSRELKRRLWTVFKGHHYLSGLLHPLCRMYVALFGGQPVALCATNPNAGHRGARLIHRLVVLPDYQGMGIGIRLLDAVAGIEGIEHRMSIVTSHPALIRALERRRTWCLSRIARCTLRGHGGISRMKGSTGRTTCAFVFRGPA